MPFNNNITPGAPPLLWSDVNDAFTRINENFDIIVATVGGGGALTPIDFTSLDTSVKPTVDNLRDLGDITHRWKGVFAGEYTDADLLNGVWTGTAQIKGVAGTVNLPAGSTVGGNPLTGVGSSLIIDPDKTFFKSVQVDNANSIEATTFGDTLNLISGSGVSMLVSSGADSITISNTGLLAVTSGSGITVTTVSGTATVTNSGVRSLQSTTTLPVGRATGAGINITAGTGDNLRITNTGVIDVQAGSGALAVSTDIVTGIVTVTNTAPAQPAFQQIEVNGDSGNRLIADSTAGVFRVVSGQGITLAKNPATDTVTITVDPVFDLKGSVFADDSTLMVDAVSGIIPAAVVSGTFTGSVIGNVTGNVTGDLKGSVFGDDSSILVDAVSNFIYSNVRATTLRTADTKIALGSLAGETNQGVSSIAIGALAGYTNQGLQSVAVGAGTGNTDQGLQSVAVGNLAGSLNQGQRAIAIGSQAGGSSQGANAIAIGWLAGTASQTAGSIVINASGVTLDGATAGFYVDPIRSTANGRPLMYDTSTKELFSSNVLEFIGSKISTSDSSGITVDVLTTFNSDVIVENELTVNGQVTIGGDLIVNGTTTTINAVTLTVDDKNIELGSTASPTDVTADGGGITLKGTTDKTFTYVNSTDLWTANIGIAASSFTGSAAAATTGSTAASVGYMGIPQSATATTGTLVIGDAGKHIYVNTNSQTITIPANAAVPYPIGTAISFIAGLSATTMNIANNDTMYLAGTGASGTRTLAANGMATAIKIAATVWYISGTGLT